jgi:hypothetical protein
MCSWKKSRPWPATADLDTRLPWCEYLFQKITQHADSDNVWCGVPYRFLAKNDIKQSSKKIVALRMAIQHQVPRFGDKSNRPEFIIARHHFPRALLECRAAWKIKAGTTFLSTEQAQLIAKRDHFDSVWNKETCNKVLTLLEKAGRSTLKSSDCY